MAGLTALALGLRWALADHQSLGPDELFTYGYTVDQSLGHVLRADNENNPPLFYVMAWLSAKAGDPTFSIRLPSVLLGAACVPVVYALGTRTVGRGAALVAATVMAVAPFSLFYGTEARAYSPLMFFTGLSTLALVAALQSHRPLRWAVYVLASCAVLYTHYLGGLVLAAQLIWAVLAHRHMLKPVLASNVAVIIACLPLLPSLLGDRSLPAPGQAPSLERVWEQALRVFPGYPLTSTSDLPGLAGMIAVAVAVALGLLGIGLRSSRRDAWREVRRGERTEPLLLILIVVTTFGGFLLYTVAGEAYFLARYLGMALPAFALLLGALVTSGPGPLAATATCLVVIVVALGAASTFDARYQRPDYKGAAEFVDRESRPGDVIVDPHLGSTVAYQAFLPVLGTAHQTQLSVNLADDDGLLRAGTLLDAVTRVHPPHRIFAVEPRGLGETTAGIPVHLLRRTTFEGVEPVNVLSYAPETGVGRLSGPTRAGLPDRRDVDAMRACLRRQGLRPEFAAPPAGAVMLEYAAHGGGKGLVVLFASADAASEAVEGVESVVSSHGGKAASVGRTVVGFTEPPTDRDRHMVARCR